MYQYPPEAGSGQYVLKSLPFTILERLNNVGLQ